MKMANLIIVAGTGRNVGKTECVCRLISKISQQTEVYGLKVSAIYPDEGIHHGSHQNVSPSLNLVEEHRVDLEKDTCRMLRAGARKVFYLQGDDGAIERGFAHFLSRVPAHSPIVCESGSLHKFVEPSLLILVKSVDQDSKPRATELHECASLVMHSDGSSGFPGLESISFTKDYGWILESNRSG